MLVPNDNRGRGWRYMAPWAERRAPLDEDLTEYGPAPSTFARHVAKHKDWSWQRPKAERGNLGNAEEVLALLDSDASIPPREREIGQLVYVELQAVRAVARDLGISRRTVRTYVNRLRRRAHGTQG